MSDETEGPITENTIAIIAGSLLSGLVNNRAYWKAEPGDDDYVSDPIEWAVDTAFEIAEQVQAGRVYYSVAQPDKVRSWNTR